MSRRATRSSVVVASLALLATTACSAQSSTGSSSASGSSSGQVQLVTPGTLTVCTHLSYKPFEYTQNGQTVGFDMDVVNAVAQRLHAKVAVVDIEWASIVSGAVYASKRCDISVGGATITPERQKAVDFSDAYFDASQVLMARKGSGITGLASLKGRKLAVQTDTTGQIYGQKNAAANGYGTVVFDDLVSTLNAVKSGRTQAAINDNGVVLDYVKANPDVQVVAQFDTGEKYGVMMAKGNSAMQQAVNQTITSMRSDGSYTTSYKKWFGTTPTR